MRQKFDLDKLLDENNLSYDEKIFFLTIINNIYSHPEFQKRLDNKIYPHHSTISLGNHILSDAIVAYKLGLSSKYGPLNLKLIILIAMFHDLYELPWQNSGIIKSRTQNRHGFTHPIEAAINAITWFPEYFQNEDEAIILIDGIIHHMYPFPVRSLKEGFHEAELNNLEKINNLPINLKNIIINSSSRKTIFRVSFSKSRYNEGRIVSKADKIVALRKEKPNFNSYRASITGKNMDLLKKN